ncbi:DNA polymerase I [Thermus filiformis]|uniref:DNA polymerase I, thermostable n=2 Tax=Thermus filiformis TaxID=276 RepID=DPO1_THEFI|nr:DNA polymerase I [Thermus filiformis]O52225.1 RecName: Full=DNA polymerase I, thermostable; AltName: Full=TFI polymerase 1 [Thermus filiformis]AAC46079.1 thermostable DNA polymerase [Thermus filiformis]KGQ20947.1 DNA polymerase I [Thermus filiformis]
MTPLFDLEEPPKRVLLVDGHHLAYRTFYALSLTTSRGEPVQMVYGFARSLLKALKEDGQAVVVVFDAKAPSFRHEAYEAYKAGRAPTPEDFPRQLALVKRLVDLLGLVRLEAPGYEADDVLGTLAKKAEREGMEVRILTGDRDFFQLLSEKVSVLLPDGTLVTPKDVQEKYGVPPERWVDFRALTGDRSDNIPGVAGIGEKTALRLLAEWGSVENLLKNLDRVKPDSLRRKIEAHLEDLHLSLDLARIRTDLPLEVDFKALRRRTPDLEGLRAFLEELEFGSLLHEFGLLGGEKPREEAPWPPPEGAFVGFLLSRKEPMWAELLALAAASEGRVHRATSPVEALADLKEARGFLAKDLAVLALREGVALDPTDDPLLVAYLLDPANTHPEGVARRYGGEFTEDAAERALLSERLFQNLFPRLSEKLLWLYQEVERPLSRVLAHMEARGVRLDVPLLEALSFELEKEMERLEGEVFRLAGHPFNLNSRDQLERVLFDELGLTPVGRTEKTGKRSTAQGALEALRGAHPIVELILQYRELSKLKSTYLDPLPRLVHPRTGRLHTRFNQTATATGRLSSSDPNLQNIPVRTPLGQRIRKAFVAEEGWLLLAADYSQIELRVLAHLSGDENLKRVFREGKDIHTETAAWMFGLDPALVDPKMRRAAKTVNFGVLYGMSAHRLSQELGIDYKEAEAFIERYFQSFPKVRAWIERTLEEGRTRGYVETLFGRRRYVPDLASRVRSVREAAERMAFNMPVQGTAADLMKIAMVKLFPRLKPLGAHLLLQVHDELVLEVPEDRAEEAKALVKEVMENAYPLDVPLEVEVGVGRDWLEAKQD